MDYPAALNSPQYVLSNLSTTSATVTIEEQFKNVTRVIIDNTMGSTPAFVTGSPISAAAVFPSSATTSAAGSIVGPGTVQTYFKDPNHGFISAIRQSGTADLYIMLAQGD
jgi:hypothetical protein